MKKVLSLFFGLTLSVFGQELAEPAKPELKVDLANVKHALKPMLWKVEKKGVTGNCWLFGTVHVADPRITTLHPAVAKAFDKADRVYTEVDMSMVAQLKAAQVMMRKDGKTMEESLGADLVKKVNAELASISPMFSVKVFNPMKTWMLVVILPQLKEQLGGKEPLDIQLWKKAGAAGKVRVALETAQEQMGGLDTLTEKEQVKMVQLTLDALAEARKQNVDPLKVILDLYLVGDTKKMADFFEKEFNNEKVPKVIAAKFLKGLLHDRNERIANNIDKQISTHPAKSHFFAVGTAHYLNDKNIRELLVKKGYRVVRVVKLAVPEL